MIKACNLTIDPQFVMTTDWDYHQYANCAGNIYLIIKMVDGSQHRIEHAPHLLGGVDCYKVEGAIWQSKTTT